MATGGTGNLGKEVQKLMDGTYLSSSDLDIIRQTSFEINNILKKFFDESNLILVDFKLEFGKHKNKILLGDEISPDTCRLWDKTTKEKLDKDRFRRDLGKIEEAYQEVLKRLESIK